MKTSPDVALLSVGGISVPVPRQALYDAAADLRLATEARVRAEDCISAVEIVLSAMERAGTILFRTQDMVNYDHN